MSTEALLERARALLMRTMTFYRDDPRTSQWLRGRLERLDQPLRIAVSGRVKSGKSTLINALIGTDLAPTDAEERTQVPTFYQYGPEPKIMVHTPHGAVQNVPASTLDAATIRDLQHWRPDEVERLVIESPTPGLQAITLIETPGVASAAVQENGRAALAQILSESDAVLYLTRYPRQADLQFLQSVNELQTARSVPISTILAFSRADETGSGGAEALVAAEKTAEKYRGDPTLRSFAQHFIPVVGLLGQAAATMTDDDFKILVFLSRLSDRDREVLLLSAERFVKAGLEAVPSPVRQRLLEKFGHFGISRCLELLRGGVDSAQRLREALLDESGMHQLQTTLHEQFVERQDALRARSALLAVDMVLRANPRPGVQVLLAEFERVLTSAHEWNELRLLSALESGQIRFPRPLQTEAKRLLGGSGHSTHARLGLDETALTADLADAAASSLNRWREQTVNPMHDRAQRDAVRTVVRSCERIILQQAQGGGQQPAQRPAQQQRAQQPQPAQPQRPAQQPQPGWQQPAQRPAQQITQQPAQPQHPAAQPAAVVDESARGGRRRRADDGDTGTGRRRRVEDTGSGRRRRADDADTGTGRRHLPDGGSGTGRRHRPEGQAENPEGRRRLRAGVGQSTGTHARPDPEEAPHFVDPTPSGRHSRE